MLDGRRGWEHSQRVEDFGSMFYITAGKFPDDEWMTQDEIVVEQPP